MAWYNEKANPQDLIPFKKVGLPYQEAGFVNDQPMARQQIIDVLLKAKDKGYKFTLSGGYGKGHKSLEHTTYGTAVDLVTPDNDYSKLSKFFKDQGANVLVHNAGSGMHIHLTPGQAMMAEGIQSKPTQKPGIADRIAQAIISPVSAKKPVLTGEVTKNVEQPTGETNMGYLGKLPTLGKSLRQGNETMPPSKLSPAMQQQMMAMRQPQGQQMPSGGMAAQGRPQQPMSQQGQPMGAAQSAKEKKKMNLTPLSLALIGIGQNLMHPAGSGEFNALSDYLSQNKLNEQNIAADKEKQDKQQALEREKMQLEKELTERKLASSEAESARRESYQDKLLALQEKELAMKAQDAGVEDIFGGNKNPTLTALRVMNDPEKFNKLTSETQGLLRQYAENAVKDPNALFEQKQAEAQGKQTGQTGLRGATVSDVERAKLGGKSLAATEASYASMKAKMPELEQTVDELSKLSEIATYTKAGEAFNEVRRQLGLDVGSGAEAKAKYESMVNNQVLPLLRDTFGAQFTEREGQTLRETLGDTTKSPREKQTVLDAFIRQKQMSIESAQRQMQIQQQQGNISLPGSPQTDTFSRQQLLEEAQRRNLM